MAVVIGEAAVRIRGDADRSEIRAEVEPAVSGALEDAGESGSDAFSAKMAAGIAGAGALIAGGFAASLEEAALGDKLTAQLGASGAESERYGQVAGDLYAGAYGESLGDVNDALRGVVQNVSGMADASAADLQSVTGSVLDLATAMDQDVGATSQAVGRLIQTGLASNAQEALDIVTRGFQEGADRGGDFLDVIGEYGTTFSELGLQGPEAVGLINQALAAGIPNADFAADALREVGIIGREGGEEAAEALEAIGLDAEGYFARMRDGGGDASLALDQVLDALRNTEDPALRASAATALVGTQYEDLGDAILQLDPSEAEASLGTIEGAADRLGETLNDNASTNLTSFWRSAQTAFVDVIGGQVIPVVERVASFLATNFGPTLDTVGGIVTDRVVPPLRDLIGWLGENEGLVTVLSYAVGTVLVGALGVWGTRSVIESAKSVAGWFSTAAASTTSAGRQQASALQVVAGWVLMGTQALIQGIKVAAVWTAQIVASAVTGAASFLVSVATVVAGWVLMGAQALLAGARIALAWLIALGPIGLVIAAVAGLVALVVINYDEIVAAIGAAWEWIKSSAGAAWEWITTAVSTAVDFLVGLFMNFTIVGLIIQHWDTIVAFTQNAWRMVSDAVGAGIQWIVDFVTGLPGRIWAALSSLGSLLAGIFSAAWQWVSNVVVGAVSWIVGFVAAIPGNLWNGLLNLGRMLGDLFGGAWRWAGDAVRAGVDWIVGFVSGIPGRILGGLSNIGGLLVGLGGDLIQGLVNGISGAASFVGDVAGNIWRAIKGFVNSNVIDRLNNLLEFEIAGITVNPPDIPRLHSGGVFDSGSTAGEGLALLRDDELVATPEQRRVADDLLRGLLAGRLPGVTPATGAAGGSSVTIVENVYAAPGESAAVTAARATEGVVWNLNAGITRRAPLPAGATP